MNPKVRLFLLFLYYCTPPALIALEIVPYSYRYELIGSGFLGIYLYAFWNRFSFESLGIRWDNFRDALKWQVGVTVPMTLIALAIKNHGLVRTLSDTPESIWFYVMYLFISGPVQESIYRGIAFAEFRKHKYLSPWMIITLATFNFGFLHVIYLEWIILASTTFMGLIWTIIYYYKPNLWAVSIAHAICGFLAIWFGLI